MNRGEHDGLSFEILPRETVPAHMEELAAVSANWLALKNAREKRFSLGAFDPNYVKRFAVAVARHGTRIVAFATVMSTDTKAEASVDLMRHAREAPSSAMVFLFINLILCFKAQGFRRFALGLAPLSGLETHPLAPVWHRFGHLIYNRGERFYNFRGLLVVGSSGPEADAQPDLRQQFLALMEWLDPGIANQAESTTDLSGVPLVEVPATDGGEYLALILTGDGGWAALDKAVASRLVRRHISTLGWDSLSYFWRARTPDEAGADLERSLRHYLVAWEKQRVLLIGYSFGANVLPFMANRLPPDLRGRIELVVLLGPGPSASFEFHLTDWLGSSSSAKRYPILTELQKLTWTKVLCLSGQQDESSICPTLNLPNVTVEQMPGDHHFNDDYGKLVSRILALLPEHASAQHRALRNRSRWVSTSSAQAVGSGIHT